MDFGISDMFDAERDAAAEATFAEGLDDAQAAAAEARVTALEALYDQDRGAYAAAYLDIARAWLEERGLSAAVELIRTDHDQPGYRSGPDSLKVDWTGLDEQLGQHAREYTKLPQTDAPPDWSTGGPAEAIRAAGRTYGERVDQAAGGPRAGSDPSPRVVAGRGHAAPVAAGVRDDPRCLIPAEHAPAWCGWRRDTSRCTGGSSPKPSGQISVATPPGIGLDWWCGR